MQRVYEENEWGKVSKRIITPCLNRVQSLPSPVFIEGELEYEISEIVDSKIDKR